MLTHLPAAIEESHVCGDLLAVSGHDVRIWGLEPDVVSAINTRHANPVFLPGFTLATSLVATHDHDEALDGAGLVVYAAPSH